MSQEEWEYIDSMIEDTFWWECEKCGCANSDAVGDKLFVCRRCEALYTMGNNGKFVSAIGFFAQD